MTDTTAILGLPYLLPSQAQKHVTHNEALRQLDALVQLSAAEIGADTVAVTWDGRAVFPPFGLTIRQGPDGWRVVPPTSLPMVRRFMPDSEAEFQIWGSLLATAEALLDDLRAGVESGRIETLQQLSRQAIEDAVIPMGMVMVALGRADE